jgi:hypothetical protein
LKTPAKRAESLFRAARESREWGHGLQQVQLSKHALPPNLVSFRLDRNREVGIELDYVGAQFRRREIEFPVCQPSEQAGISFIGQRVLRRLGRLAAVKVTVGKYKCIGAHFFEKDPVLIDGSVDAPDIQVLCLRCRVIEG